MLWASTGDSIDKEILNRRLCFLNGVEVRTSILETRLDFGNSSRGVVDNYVHAISSQYKTCNSFGMLESVANYTWLGRAYGQHIFAHARFEIRRRVAEQQLALMH
jgi:hypothetical protein